eukprot:Gregarina_sp_Pseudo_9__5349@NODE_638_length_2440_cov_27_670554_g602_i0_p3_GENE_NODE_638_length_2440_cov_27_670554_g602_i0NODE_638_length_2440_cov_27_670554_g602_i0_p3_ORF_typecomplete_len234_score36_44Methyltransf_3/PF01596_17/3_9e31Methyltransf_24/PF13578_6/3_8e03Methyltransf_24/PF13578_6/1_1e13Cons_hypoth95/PF03602_15/1_3e06Methyltransf_31/PF13847_6/0_0098PCMT/PF01135_19/0_043TRM/PF02005_16/0_23_NODE_638_length_2440_cov_27_670554_g602_i016462347
MSVTHQKEICHDGREVEVLNLVFQKHQEQSLENKPDKIIEVINGTADKFFLMTVGENKCEFLIPRIRSHIEKLGNRPIRMLELGAYVGWSAIKFAPLLPPKSQYVSLEAEPLFAAISTKLVELAGLRDTVKILVGPADQTIQKRLKDTPQFDIVFIDHYKEYYLRDLKLLEEVHLVGPGTLVIADNVVTPGAPEYLEHVRGDAKKYQSEFISAEIRAKDRSIPDGLEVSLCLA